MADLSPYHLLVVRPERQAQQWAEQLQGLGAWVSKQPMMHITPLTDDISQRAIINRILGFAEYQKAIFISQNAVVYGMEWLDQYWPQLPVEMNYFAIGQATATLLAESMQTGMLYESPLQAMNSEALLTHPKLQSVSGEKIIIFRGKGGRTHLADSLQTRGAQVDYCEVYQRQTPHSVSSLEPSFRSTTRHAVMAVHSVETLHNVCTYIENSDLQWLKQQTLLVSGQRVAEAASEAGFRSLCIADNATHDSMIDALLNSNMCANSE
ncbi:uroporphyrinogen-III synthase [Eionea flava]